LLSSKNHIKKVVKTIFVLIIKYKPKIKIVQLQVCLVILQAPITSENKLEGGLVLGKLAGWPDWANLYQLGDCLLWAIF
jgi:hypothetical protein